MMTPTTTTAKASATTRTIMDDSIVKLLSGSPRSSGRTRIPANLSFPCSFEVAAQSEDCRSQQHNEKAGEDEKN
jgi:hypothetical protein